MGKVVAVDSGGTFTDCVVLDDDGRVTTAKAPSTPSDFSVGVVGAVAGAAEQLGIGLDDVLRDTGLFCHGTTVATNALLTRSGSRVGLITTKGHEDALIIGRTIQKAAGLRDAELTNLARLEKADPIVPRPLIRGVTERVDYKGAVVVALDLDDARRAVAELAGAGAEAVAVCFLWSFMNPAHERAVQELVRMEFPQLLVTTSHAVAPVIKEYERGASTVLNAYLGPITRSYISALEGKLADGGLPRPLVIMQSSGGVTSAEDAKNHAVSLLASGPAGGVLGAAALGRLMGAPNIVTTDVGGTSFDVGLVVDGEPVMAGNPVFGKYHTVLPVIDVASIGAGGGSIAWLEPGTGLLKVGPQSAGADPGPACYGTGGTEPTVTDANVVLGRIDPTYFLGGARALAAERAVAVIRDRIADPLGISVEDAAMGIVEILDARMADLVRTETIGRGYDPREFALFAFGGAGPLHVGAYGLDVGADQIVVPAHSSVFSAFGIAGSDMVKVHQVSDPMIAPFATDRLNDLYEQLEAAVLKDLEATGIATENATLAREIEMRYRGQVHEVRVPVPAARLTETQMDGVIADFEQRYNRRYGRGAAYGQAGIEARTYLVRGTGSLVKPQVVATELGAADASAARIGDRDVFFRSLGFVPTAVHRRELLEPGNIVEGPAVVEAVDTTILVHPGQRVRVDEWTNLLFETGGAGAMSVPYVDETIALIDQEELVKLALDLANIDSPPGQEKPVSDYVYSWLRENGFTAAQIAMVPERPNVVGRLSGSGGGLDLIFNAHMDVAWGPDERRWMHDPDNPFYVSAWRDGATLIGNGLVNDKGPLACTLIAAKAVKEAGVPLLGDLIVTGVCGEIGQEPVDEFAAPEFLSKEVGTRYLVTHGVIGDFAVVAEATDFGLTWVEAGKAFFKITVLGGSSRYTPYIDHPESLADNQNAVVRAVPVIEHLEPWARRYQEEHTYRFDGGTCIPKVNLGAVRGGQPFIPIVTAERCYLYLDVRLNPGQTAMEVQAELKSVLAEIDVPTEVACTLYRRGYEAAGVDTLIEATRTAHRAEFGTDPGEAEPALSSMWRDTNPFNELGIPAITYGPAAGVGGGLFWAEAEDFTRAARIYARMAIDVCCRKRP